jgi:hypothetical protein
MSQSAYETGDRIFEEVLRSAPRGEKLQAENRGSWYCPCATGRHESIIRTLAEDINADRIYDLGAGDLRLSVALSDEYEVIAYENNEFLAKRAYNLHGEPDIELRTQDYYAHWGAMNHKNAVFAAIGKTNKVPGTPQNGVAIEGCDKIQIAYPDATEET